jgi:hypothetical protein
VPLDSAPKDGECAARRFNVRWEASFHVSDSGSEAGTRSFYGKRIGIIDTPNDTTHEVSIESVEALESWDQETLDEAVEDGNIESWKLNVVFQDLVNKGVLQPGKYYVRVCW